MAKVLLLLFGIAVVQHWSCAAPNVAKEETQSVPANVEGDVTLDGEPHNGKHSKNKNDDSHSQRQKRFYDITGFDNSPYDFPPAFAYPSLPHYSKRDDSHSTAVFGTQDPLALILKRVQEIARDYRYQNVQRPVYAPIPAYLPIFYIPQFGCSCSNNRETAPPVNKPQSPLQPTNSLKPADGIDTTTHTGVTLDNRVGFEDKKQNWGITINETDLNDVVDMSDGRRPINFDPIPIDEPLDIDVPPVDHGTIQAGIGNAPSANEINRRPETQRIPTATYVPHLAADNVNSQTSSSKNVALNLCDGAILTCCSRTPITLKCFESQGCENPQIYGKPCDPNVINQVISKFTIFHKRRSG